MPLSGVRVLDLTRVLSGPFCTALLGDMGADVIKVEAPEGDSIRGQGAIKDGLSGYFAQFNRNKRSIRLDLRKPEGRDILARLIAQSDPGDDSGAHPEPSDLRQVRLVNLDDDVTGPDVLRRPDRRPRSQVCPGAEAATRAGQHQCPDIVVGAQVCQRVGHLGTHLR